MKKKASKKKAKSPSRKKAPARKARKRAPRTVPKKADTGVELVDPKTLPKTARKRRASKFDDTAKALLKNPSKAAVVIVPKDKNQSIYRTMLYARIAKCIDYFKPNHGKKVSISKVDDRKLAIVLVDA